MNDPAHRLYVEDEAAFTSAATPPSLLNQLEDLIRRHPVAAAVTTLGIGCAIALAIREAITPPPPPSAKQRALDLLSDIQARLAEFMDPVGERVSELAEDGVSAVKSGLHSVAESKPAYRFRNLFS